MSWCRLRNIRNGLGKSLLPTKLQVSVSSLIFFKNCIPLRPQRVHDRRAVLFFFEDMNERRENGEQDNTEDDVFDINASVSNQFASEIAQVCQAHCP